MMSLSNKVPSHLTIRILYSDDDIVVIDKPCDLRSVPGHASPPAPQSHPPRRTAQEAWVQAIRFMSADRFTVGDPGEEKDVAVSTELMHNLGNTVDSICVPRKLDTFLKYCHRNSKRLLPSFPDLHAKKDRVSSKIDQDQSRQKKPKIDNASLSMLGRISHACYVKIQNEQRLLMNLPKPTEDWESAIGQLRILGFGDYSHNVSPISGNNDVTESKKLFVVHRLDCQTSGIMVFARNRETASSLCRAWRERETVRKVYMAHVRHWPPYHQQGMSEGTIDLALAPSRTERIKWEITPVEKGGKECRTFWRVFEDIDENPIVKEMPLNKSRNNVNGITLELHPLTGRTHQLRIHCAAVGSGIVGDSLYGDSPIAWVGDNSSVTQSDDKQDSGIEPVKTLRLHAHRLSFPTKTGKRITFESPKPW